MKNSAILITLLLLSLTISGCLDIGEKSEKTDGITYELYVVDSWEEENYLDWAQINDSVIYEKTDEYWNVSIIDGRGGDVDAGWIDFETEGWNLSGDYLKILTPFVKYLLFNSENINDTVEKGDHLSFFWRSKIPPFGFWLKEYVHIWDDEGLKYSFQWNLDPLVLDDENSLNVYRDDILIDTIGLNDTDLIEPQHSTIPPSERYPVERTALWSHLNDTFLFINRSVAEDLGYNIIKMNRTLIGHPFIQGGAFYYDQYLYFTLDNLNISLQLGGIENMTFGGHEFLIKVVHLQRRTTLMNYGFLIDGPPDTGHKFFIERKD